MPKPHRCPHPRCAAHHHPGSDWYVRCGYYHTTAHGSVRRYRCRSCGRTLSDQTESLHYYAKRRLPLRAITESLLAGASQREVARRYRVSPMAIQHAVLRLGRQAMAAHVRMLAALPPLRTVAFDGLRSFVTSQDFPCDLTTVVASTGEVVLAIDHTIMRRSGRMTGAQRRRTVSKYRVWTPKAGSVGAGITRIVGELLHYLRPDHAEPAAIDTDDHPHYARVLTRHPVATHLRRCGLLRHIRTPSTAPRGTTNRLFPVNYLDRLLRHRLREHTRETIAFGRHAGMQMHRAWLFAWDHNVRRAHRVRRPERGVHLEQAGVASEVVGRLRRDFFTRRMPVYGCTVPDSIVRVWMGATATPPLRWRRGQRGSSVRIPAFAFRDLAYAYHHAC